MFHDRIDAAPRGEPNEGLVAEVVRRLIRKPGYAAADEEALRALVRGEMHRGTVTMFGLVRAVERAR